MRKHLVALIGAALLAAAPAYAHPTYHHQGSCDLRRMPDGSEQVVVTVLATDAVTGMPAWVPVEAYCVEYGNVVVSASGTGYATNSAEWNGADQTELCLYVSVGGDFEGGGCESESVTPVVPEPVNGLVEQMLVVVNGLVGDATSKLGCDDGLDNDADGRIDEAQDPGCDGGADPSERGNDVCDDGLDNDGDLAPDYPADMGCTGPDDTDEGGPAACADGVDNDGDFTVDSGDPGCSGTSDTEERGTSACDDGMDNDSDGSNDYPRDAGCAGPGDGDERGGTFPCDDGVDNDGDTYSDYPNDPGCGSPLDPNEATIP